MSLLLALTGAAPSGNSQALAVTLDGVVFSASQAKKQPQSLGVVLDGISIAIAQGSQVAQSSSAEVELKRWYVKRGKKLHIFANADDADSFIEANEKASIAIAQAQKTSRLARKRLRTRLVSVSLPAQTVDTDHLAQLVNRYAIPVNLPALLQQQDYERVMQIMALALQAQDEEEVEMLLLA